MFIIKSAAVGCLLVGAPLFTSLPRLTETWQILLLHVGSMVVVSCDGLGLFVGHSADGSKVIKSWLDEIGMRRRSGSDTTSCS